MRKILIAFLVFVVLSIIGAAAYLLLPDEQTVSSGMAATLEVRLGEKSAMVEFEKIEPVMVKQQKAIRLTDILEASGIVPDARRMKFDFKAADDFEPGKKLGKFLSYEEFSHGYAIEGDMGVDIIWDDQVKLVNTWKVKGAEAVLIKK